MSNVNAIAVPYCKHGNPEETCDKCLRERLAELTAVKPESLPQTRLHIGRRTEAVKDLPSGSIIRIGDHVGILSRDEDVLFFTTLPKFETATIHYVVENVEVIGFLNITVDGK